MKVCPDDADRSMRKIIAGSERMVMLKAAESIRKKVSSRGTESNQAT